MIRYGSTIKLVEPLLALQPKRCKAVLATKYGVEDIKGEDLTNDIFSKENVTFGNMSTGGMVRSITVLRICSLPGMADNAEKVLRFTRICLGKRLFHKIMRWTAYGQFVAGDKIKEIQQTTEKLRKCDIDTILAVPIEDLGDEAELTGDELFDDNASKVLSCVDISRDTAMEGREPQMQLKLAAIISYEVLVKSSEFLSQEPKSRELAVWMQKGCDDKELAGILPNLSHQERSDFTSGVQRLVKIIEYAAKNNVRVLIDAEYTWINPAIQQISIALMRVYNTHKAVVFKTYQAYLKESHELIQKHSKECEEAGVHFAFKLVRGAYLLPETQKNGSHPPWICDNWEATNINYNNCLKYALSLDSIRTRILFATHNEGSIRLAAELLRKRNVEGTNVAFAQLYGMADYMSFTLGKMGFEIYKSLPYGSVEDTLPYLSRRAKENTLFLTGVRRDMDMLKMGLRRKLGW